MTEEADIRRGLEGLAQAYGFKGFMVMCVPGRDTHRLAESTLLTNWPREFLTGYDDACLMAGSPIIDRLRRSTIPFTYDTQVDSRRRLDGKGAVVISLFEQVNMKRGIYVPVHDTSGNCGAVAFGGDREMVSAEEMRELNFVAGGLFNRLSELRAQKNVKGAKLSKRELECLYWAAAGKTTSEMAKILFLSDYTVNHYLNRATRKLDSVNRVQTVVKAIRAGLIN
ncbi:autoinducer binding domain-containing protein [Rhizobium sp. 32-5/1]|uniref:helix-turn-helix transcriptional regulator n=1 Tax=Rhizobium sp. 32-5/1 TaxID=3019602 RepID=UPI00240D9701|nr:autoinducer binding domain-containing protein [Rhizobium sp. 32-5/1]WEZ84228.1 autoinducer binding domain-containing protein [Rhizobium sp. 32-5/1]